MEETPITKTVVPYEFLGRWNGGVFAGAHVRFLEIIAQGEKVLSQREGHALPVAVGAGQGFPLADILTSIQVQSITQRDDAIAAQSAAESALSKVQGEHAAALAAKDAEIARLAALTYCTIGDVAVDVIKAERDRRNAGGVKVGSKWFHSDQTSVIQYNSLMMLGAKLPEGTVLRKDWRTMDGSTVDMTPALVAQILTAGLAAFAANDDAAQTHKNNRDASGNPAAYDFSTGWPPVFGE